MEEESSNRDPLFLLHDLGHGGLEKHEDSREDIKALTKLIKDEYGNAYKNSDGIDLKNKDISAYDFCKIIFGNDIMPVVDWHNHLFSLSLSKGKGYLKFDDTVEVGSPSEIYYKKDEYKDIDLAGSIEDLIGPYMKKKMNYFKGKVVFAIN